MCGSVCQNVFKAWCNKHVSFTHLWKKLWDLISLFKPGPFPQHHDWTGSALSFRSYQTWQGYSDSSEKPQLGWCRVEVSPRERWVEKGRVSDTQVLLNISLTARGLGWWQWIIHPPNMGCVPTVGHICSGSWRLMQSTSKHEPHWPKEAKNHQYQHLIQLQILCSNEFSLERNYLPGHSVQFCQFQMALDKGFLCCSFCFLSIMHRSWWKPSGIFMALKQECVQFGVKS